VSLARRLLNRPAEEQRSISSLADYVTAATSLTYRPAIEQTLADGHRAQMAAGDFGGNSARYSGNGPIASLVSFRAATFAAGRFRWLRIREGRPSEFYGTPALRLLERPWIGGTTQDLLSRMETDASLSGNAYLTTEQRSGGTVELVRLSPDSVDVVLEELPSGVGWRKIGFIFHPDPHGRDPRQAKFLLVNQVAHYMPMPDPHSPWRGMSWMTPLVREVFADDMTTRHVGRYFENAATPNAIARYPETMDVTKVRAYAALFEETLAGPANAGKTAHLGGGVDLTIVGANLRDTEARLMRAAGETRFASAAGVPPVLVGFSEGSESSSYAHYSAARRRYVDATLHPLWGNIAGSMEVVAPPPDPGTRLAIDGRDVPLLREDSKDEAAIRQMTAGTMRTLIDTGYTPESVARFAQSGDFGLLVHTGLFSVQLQAPGAPGAAAAPPSAVQEGE